MPHLVSRPERWDVPFDSTMTREQVDRLILQEPFSRIDQSAFPATTSFHDILQNDSRIVRYQSGDIVVRQGDYGNSAFFVLEGAVRVVLDQLPGSVLGHREPRRKNIVRTFLDLIRNRDIPEIYRDREVAAEKSLGVRPVEDIRHTRVFVQDVPAILDGRRNVRLKSGELFGELAALGRMPRSSTVVAEDGAVLLEIRWQGLRDIRQWAPNIRELVDRQYRQSALTEHLRALPMLQYLNEQQHEYVKNVTELKSYGKFDWHGTFKSLAEASAKKRLQDEPVIAKEGDYPNGLILVRSGFVRVSVEHGEGHQTISYLGRGQAYGFDELAHNARHHDDPVTMQCSLRAVGYVDILQIPTYVVENTILPSLPPEAMPPPVTRRLARFRLGDDGQEQGPRELGAVEGGLKTGILEELVDRRLINGKQAMVIDMDRCTRCDDCVRACASTHANNPRFIRHGPIIDGYMVANACMHCADPVCMIGCPTGAIHRNELGGEVVINEMTCVGCSSCANSCPYDNIRMVEKRDPSGTMMLDRTTHNPLTKATKCDLCVDQWGGPACQRACPHDALRRIDLRDDDQLTSWTKR